MVTLTQISYQVQPLPEKHLFKVKCVVLNPDPEGQKFSLPAWIPGSYLIRDFAKHIVSLEVVSQSGTSVAVQMVDKNTWICVPTAEFLTISYEVYSFDLIPRGAHVDNTHAFFNGSRLFLQIAGFEQLPCSVEILPPAEEKYSHWRVGTSMKGLTDSYGYGRYEAENYEDLIDHPVEIGDFQAIGFEAGGVPHEIIITGKHSGDLDRLCQDLRLICEHHIQFFKMPAPMEKYVFLLTLLGEGYGGLEHRSASAIHCKRDCLPKKNENGVSDAYCSLLGLLSHEYFHAWNVKRIKPAAFAPYNLNVENYTRQLWIFEGITSYYDELALVRTGLISKEKYLQLLAETITRVYATPGRFKQTLEQASFEAWTKFYKPDENSPNATISYYTKGALVALALDLSLRHESRNQYTLDDVMRALWVKYGITEQRLGEHDFERLVVEITGHNFKAFFDDALRSTKDLSLSSLFEKIGIALEFLPAASMEDLGNCKSSASPIKPLLEVRLKPATTEVQLAYVFAGSSAEAAGLAPNDVIVAVNGVRVDRARFEAVIANFSVGDEVIIHAFRRDELMTFTVVLQSGWLQVCTLHLTDNLSETQQKIFNDWLKS